MIEKWKRRKSREDWQESRKEKRKKPSKRKEKRDLLKPERTRWEEEETVSYSTIFGCIESYDQPGTSKNSLLFSSSSESGDIPHTTTRDVRVPVRFRDDESELSDGSQSDTVCKDCQCHEPVGYDGDDIFWEPLCQMVKMVSYILY